MFSFGPFRPDEEGPGPGTADIADSVIPQAAPDGIGYGPFPSLVTPASATALSGAPRGNISLTLSDGTFNVFYGTASTIEQLDSGFGFTVIASGYSVTSGDDWSFLHFGSYLLNTNTTDGFRAYNVETPAGNNLVTGAPTARSLFSCNNVVFALDCNGNNRRMQSSGIGSHTAWDSLGANGKTFEDGGGLVRGVDLKNGSAVVFQSAAMRLVQFGGAPGGSLYTIAKIADGRGSVGARSIISFDGMVFYLATNGFYRFDLGGGNQPIGARKVDKWFLEQVDSGDLPGVEASIDPANKIVAWRFKPSSSSSTTVYPVMLCYHWELGEWFTVTVDTSSLARIATPGYVLDQMDSFGTLDGMIQIALDDRFWQGGQPVFAALDSTYKFSTFSGPAMAATLQSAIMNSGTQDVIRWVTPIDDSPDGLLAVGYAPTLSGSLTWMSGQSKVSSQDGRTPQRVRAANLAMKRTITAASEWSYANGFDYIGATKGGPK
jgi:hypothetical protein